MIRAWEHYDLSDDKGTQTLGTRMRRDGRINSWATFKAIIDWKARRVRGLIRRSQESRLRVVSERAFRLAEKGRPLGAIREFVDAGIRGVKTRMASTILMLYAPRRYTVMDVNAWKALVHLKRLSRTTGYKRPEDYPVYLEACIRLAEDLDWGLRDTDRALWIIGSHDGDVPTPGRRGCPHCS